MMSQRTMVVVYDYDLFKAPADHREALAALFADLPEYVCLVFVYDLIEYKADARTKLAAAIKAHGAVVKFSRQEQGDLVDWIRRRFRALDHDIDSELARYLIFLLRGPDDGAHLGDRQDRRLRPAPGGDPGRHRRRGHPAAGRGGLSAHRRHRRRGL